MGFERFREGHGEIRGRDLKAFIQRDHGTFAGARSRKFPPLAALSWMALSYPGRCPLMSQYVFHCQDCNQEFTQSLHMSDVEKGAVTCPHCGGTRVHQLVAAFTAVTSKKS
jgi:putative FmdB family regulatory protein